MSNTYDSSIANPEGFEGPKSKWRLGLLVLLIASLIFVSSLFIRYLMAPAPLPELVTGNTGNLEPHYLFSIYELDRPVGIAANQDGSRIYVAESGTERQIKIFDAYGQFQGAFAAPSTTPGERSPVYLSVAPDGRVFVTDRTQHSIYVYDQDGNYLDTILGPGLTLKEYVAKHADVDINKLQVEYDIFDQEVLYQVEGGSPQSLPVPDRPAWSPLGVWFSPTGDMLITDVMEERNSIRILSADAFATSDWSDFSPVEIIFGETGQGDGQFLFPNSAVMDSLGRVHVSDGNNGRISTWDRDGTFLFHFGLGSGDGALSLPRGMSIDANDRLYVIDAVGQHVAVYDVSADEPVFLYAFGEYGVDDGLFNYPNDIVIGTGGRIYVVDRENNRVQVWLY